MVDYTRAVKRPFGDIHKLLVGTVIQLIPLVNFMAVGYQLNCAKSAMEKNFELPQWNDWGGLFVKGLMIIVAGVVYIVPALLVGGAGLLAAVAGGGAAGLFASEGAPMVVGFGGVGASMVFAAVLMLFAVYLLPSAMLNFAKTDNFGGLFAVGVVYRRTRNWGYFKVWVFSMFYGMAAMMVLSVIPAVGNALAAFAAGVTSYTLFGELDEKL